MVASSRLATASRRPKSAARTVTELDRTAARLRMYSSTTCDPERSRSSACTWASCLVFWRTATNVTLWVATTKPIISARSRLRKLSISYVQMASPDGSPRCLDEACGGTQERDEGGRKQHFG